jgi:hypothetical protein
MSARTAAATVEKSLPVESSIEAEINSLIEQQTPKRIPVEEQTPKRIQIEDDAERSRSFVARMTSNSIDELGELASDLTSALQNLRKRTLPTPHLANLECCKSAHRHPSFGHIPTHLMRCGSQRAADLR